MNELMTQLSQLSKDLKTNNTAKEEVNKGIKGFDTNLELKDGEMKRLNDEIQELLSGKNHLIRRQTELQTQEEVLTQKRKQLLMKRLKEHKRSTNAETIESKPTDIVCNDMEMNETINNRENCGQKQEKESINGVTIESMTTQNVSIDVGMTETTINNREINVRNEDKVIDCIELEECNESTAQEVQQKVNQLERGLSDVREDPLIEVAISQQSEVSSTAPVCVANGEEEFRKEMVDSQRIRFNKSNECNTTVQKDRECNETQNKRETNVKSSQRLSANRIKTKAKIIKVIELDSDGEECGETDLQVGQQLKGVAGSQQSVATTRAPVCESESGKPFRSYMEFCKKVHSCNKCQFKTHVLNDMEEHLIRHINESFPYACTQPNCEKVFKQLNHLNEHLIHHKCGFGMDGMEPIGSTCGHNKLKAHYERVRDGVKGIYVCKDCNHKDPLLSTIKRHVHNTHVCPYRTNNSV